MAVIKINLYSYVLGKDTNVEVFIPERRHYKHEPFNGKKFRTLYFLHGHSADESAWMRHSTMEFMLSNSDYVCIMPDCGRSYFNDSERGYRYFTYLTEELPLIMSNWFPISTAREDTGVVGYSMGGTGALKCALRRPDLYSKCVCLSGDMYMQNYIRGFGKEEEVYGEDGKLYRNPHYQLEDFYSNVRNQLGDDVSDFDNSINDMEAAVRDLIASGAPMPKIYMCCGDQDALQMSNQRFYDFVKKTAPELDCVYEVTEGLHNWNYWSKELRHSLEMADIL